MRFREPRPHVLHSQPAPKFEEEGTEQPLKKTTEFAKEEDKLRPLAGNEYESSQEKEQIGAKPSSRSSTRLMVDSEAKMPNTSKPRAKAATAAPGEENKAPATKSKRTPTVTDKVKGVVEKVVDTIEDKLATVCYAPLTAPTPQSSSTMFMSIFLGAGGSQMG